MNRLLLVVLLFTVSCQSDDPPVVMPDTGLLIDNSIISNGEERSYHLFVPENYENRPLVLLLHGNGSSHDDLFGLSNVRSPYKVWLSIAGQNDLILVAPNGTLSSSDSRGWNDCRSDAISNPNTDDVRFIEDLLDHLKSNYDHDEKRVYVTGTSNGGHMAYQLAEELPVKITAFASIISSIAGNSACSNSTLPVSALFMNGTEDPILPYNGGEMSFNRGLVLSTQQSVDYWVTRNETATTPETINIPDSNTMDGSTAVKYVYSNGKNNTEVVHYEIIEGGHTEPSIQERYRDLFLLAVGSQNGDFEMTDEIWDFFKDKSK